jgi:tellurite methyltransferase
MNFGGRLMSTPAKFWDEYYVKNTYKDGKQPSDFIVDMKKRLSKGKTLDIGMGEGSNAVYLALQGFDVVGVDASQVAIDRAKDLAKNSGVTIDAVKADMDMYVMGMMQYDTIIMHEFKPSNSRYYAELMRALKQGGTLLVDSLMVQEMDGAIAQDEAYKNFYFYPNELIKNFPDLHVVFYQEDIIEGKHRVRMLARRPMDSDAAKYKMFGMASEGAKTVKNKQIELAEALFKKK